MDEKMRPGELAGGLVQPGDILLKLARGPGQNETGTVISADEQPNYIPGHASQWRIDYETPAGERKSMIMAGPHISVWVHVPTREDYR